MILTLAATQDWDMHQIDIKMAFLHGELEEEIYMEFPQGMPDKAVKICPYPSVSTLL